MKTIIAPVKNEIIVEKSRFIALLFPLTSEEEALNLLDSIRKEYTGARHYCFAYKFNDIARFSDDGEPKGTAGIPLLTLLENNELENVLLVVVRYFGGTLLGASRLLRTYVNAGKSALDLAEIIEVVPEFIYEFCIKEADLAVFYNFINREKVPFETEFKNEKVLIRVKGDERLEGALKALFYDTEIRKLSQN